MNPNGNYNYLRFMAMPFHSAMMAQPISPYRPCNLSKRVNRCEFTDTLFTIPAAGELEVIFMDGYVNGSSSDHIAFFVQVNTTPTSVIQSRASGLKRTITNKPANTEMGTCYFGGYIRIVGGSGQLSTEYRYYEPVSISNPSDYSSIVNTGTNAIKFASNPTTNNTVYINCLPTELRNKRYVNAISPEYHRMVYHVKIKNTGASSTTCSVYGSWWLETQDPAYGGISHIQDTKCPAKLAEYVISHMRNNTDIVMTDNTNYFSRYDTLDALITAALKAVLLNWKVFVVSRTQTTVIEEEEINWKNQPLISNN